ncbi:MAG: hypothetical protein KGQ48_16020 [Bradyrhizobium sp.]|nr:hypothetical protein [Bradyrhizobium sp.]
MRRTISGFVAAIAVVAAGTLPASACGVFFEPACGYVVAPIYTGCDIGCGWAYYERLPNPELQYHWPVPVVHQYYYADQGPTYTGPGDFAPYPFYQEAGGWGVYRHHRYDGYHGRAHHHVHYGYAVHHGYLR